MSSLTVFNIKISCPQNSQVPELEVSNGEMSEAPINQEMVSDLLWSLLNTHKSMGPNGIHPRVMREPAKELPEPLSIIYQQSWLTGEVPVGWKSANIRPTYKKHQKDDLGNYRPVGLSSVLGIDHNECHYTGDNQGIKPRQHGFTKQRSCLTNLISFYGKVTHLIDEGKAVDVVCLDFNKAFHTLSHSILLKKLTARSLDGWTL
ncbi:RNA-directed DNA polymerase from mobile element jockey-like protein [Pitangus sulphuratus]|nr:RNA-directed DNA polymerase from mobile element jockey-like protein [Pitangus sulphuratus]